MMHTSAPVRHYSNTALTSLDEGRRDVNLVIKLLQVA